MGKKTSETVSMGTRSKSSRDVTRSKKAPANEESTKLPTSLERRKKALPPNGTTPVWIQYYDHEAKDPNSNFGRGFQQPDDFYEKQMEAYVGSTDRFYDALQQNPEACTVVYADGGRNMKVLHHLMQDEQALHKMLESDVRKGFALPVHRSCVKNIKGAMVQPCGLAEQYTLTADGGRVPKKRLTHDLSYSITKENASVNSRIDMGKYPEMIYGCCLHRILHWKLLAAS